jgi:thiamine transporter ThiT
VAKDFKQRYSIDYDDTLSLIVKMVIVHIVLSIFPLKRLKLLST